MEIFKNKVLGNYTTLDYLGSGGFSSVYTAIHNYTKEMVGLKIAHTNNKEIISEFNNIVKSGLKGLLKMDHPDIIGIKDYFVVNDNGIDYFIMVLELVKGQSLDRTNLVDTLSLEEKLLMFHKICNAIDYAHNFEYVDHNDYQTIRIKGLFHGDIKPNNILVAPDQSPKIIDFSLLNLRKAMDESEAPRGNKDVNTGKFGTPGYMSPEQEKTGIINEATDIYSLGIVLKQLIYGLKFDKSSESNTIYKKLDQIIEKATQVMPENRYANVKELGLEIQRILNKSRSIKKFLPYIYAACIIGFILAYFLLRGSEINYNSMSSIGSLERGANPVYDQKTESAFNFEQNKYYALLIANNDYQHWKKLQYPISDVRSMKETLIENYTFEEKNIKVIENGTYEKIYKALESFNDPGINTYLLIYYAGHGKYDHVTEKAALIPVDAEENSDSRNITSDIIKDLLKKCKIHNVLFISDACYLGAMASRGENIDSLDKPAINTFKNFAGKQSRKFISSGARETVPDKSYFNEYLIKYLKNNKSDITFEYTLYNDIIGPIQNNSLATPVYGVFFDTRDEGGHFFFVKRKK
jgi:serine/threonine protein kinase